MYTSQLFRYVFVRTPWVQKYLPNVTYGRTIVTFAKKSPFVKKATVASCLECIAFRSLKTGTVKYASEEEAVSSLQIKSRPRRKRQSKEDTSESQTGVWPVVAYATAEEYNLDLLHAALKEQNLYKPSFLFSELDDGKPVDVDVVYATAQYRVDSEPREIFFFRDGAVVLWNITELEIGNILKFIKRFEQNSYNENIILDENEMMTYSYKSGKLSHLQGEQIVLVDNPPSPLDKFTFSNGLALSVKLGIWESSLESYVDSIEYVVNDLKKGFKIRLSQEDVLRKTGELFALRHHINLSSDLLDTPDFYWDHEKQERIYQQICSYLSIARRTRIMNEKLNHCIELVELLSHNLSDRHHVRLEWMIIVLIMVEVFFEILHFLDRLQ